MTLKLDTLVELEDQYSDVYPKSPTGARGWVRARRELSKRDPEVYIEWDKTHWRYHGEMDGWTFEHHFHPVEDVSEGKFDDIGPESSILGRMVEEAQRRVEEDRCPDCGEFHDRQDEFIETLQSAQESALGADGFFIITLTPSQQGDLTVYEPKIFGQCLSDMAQHIIEAQIVDVATQLFAQRMLGNIHNLGDE